MQSLCIPLLEARPQARGAGLRGNIVVFLGSCPGCRAPPGARRWLEGQHCGVSGVLTRLLGRSVLMAKIGMMLRSIWSKSS